MKLISKTLKLFLFLTLLNLIVIAQIKIHKHYDAEDGLVNNQVNRMFQDSKGYIWFSTFDGVSKWDGNHFENLQTYNGLLSSAVLDVKEGPDGKIYIACFLGGIIIYDNGVLDTLNEKNGLVSNAITSIAVLQNGDILFAGTGNKITKLKNGQLSDWGKEVNYPNDVNYTIRDNYQDKNGTLYLATQKGLLIYKNNTFKIITTKDGLNHNLLLGVNGNGNGTIYTGSYKGINKIVNGKITKLTDLPKFKDTYTYRIHVTENGTMYAATDNGIVIEKNGVVETLTENNGLSFNFAYSVLEDGNGTIYLGTNGKGFDVYNPKESIVNFNKSTGLPIESIWSILKAHDGTLYLGSTEGLIVKNESGIKILNKTNGLVGNFIRVIKQSKDGKVLVGTSSGFSILDKNKIRNYPLKNKSAITIVFSILEKDSGDIYLGTQTGLVIIKNGKVIKGISEKTKKAMVKGLGGENIYSLSETKDGSLVIGSLYGLAIHSKDKFTFYTTKNGLVDNTVNKTFVTSNGVILVGTLKGLNVIKNGEIIDTIDVNDGLSNNSISDISEDEKGRIYIPTYNGLNILTFDNDSLKIRQLYHKDGLVGNDFTQGGSFLDKEGNLWLGTLYGISKFNPNADKPITKPPRLYLSGLQLFNKDYPFEKFMENPEFNYDQNFLKFIFTGINLSAPEKIKYKYRLSGVDRDWVESQENIAPYTNLDDGDYTFEVKARNEWGYWSKPVSVAFVINPAWWETWWFRLAVISALGFLLWLAFQYRLNYLLKLERLRTKIASDLHDDVGSLLTQISINVDSLSYTKDENKRKEKRKFIGEKSKEVINMMSDVIWSIDSRNDTMESLVDRIQNFAQSFVEQKDISLEFVNQITDMKKSLKIDFRQNVMMIAKEAINNSIKYSDCSKIKIVLSYKNNLFEMIISDNGKGIDFENIKRGNGLKNMKMRADLIDAEIEFINKEGCTVHLIKDKA
ncbi:sensor histidine kinase LiaS [bacterium BMS3Abin04]|nr:sensor histidine kinase LiaS [bacterium BMS3Abin04]